jgi:hypothetical protein
MKDKCKFGQHCGARIPLQREPPMAIHSFNL